MTDACDPKAKVGGCPSGPESSVPARGETSRHDARNHRPKRARHAMQPEVADSSEWRQTSACYGMPRPTQLFIRSCVHASMRPRIHASTHPCIHPSISLSISLSLPLFLSLRASLRLQASVNLTDRPPVTDGGLRVYPQTTLQNQSVNQSLSLSIYIYIMYIYIYIYIYM